MAISIASSIVARTPALSRGSPHWRVDGGGRGIENGGQGDEGAFSQFGGVRQLARGERRVRERNKISVEGGGWWRRMSSRAGRWKRKDEAAGEHRVRGGGRGDETKARKRTRARARPKPSPRKREREKAYGGIPSLPGHPRQLPHFPFSSRVCPMLLRFRVGSGPTEPPSASPPRAALAATLPPHPLASPSRRPCSGDSHYLAYAGLARWRRMVVVCTRTMRVHVHAYTCLARSMSTPHTPSPQIPPLRLLSSSGFSAPYPSLWSLITRAGRYTFLSLGAARQLQQRNRTDLSLSLPLSLSFTDALDLEMRARSLDCIARLRMIRLDPSAQTVFRQDAAERHVRFHLMQAIFFSDLMFKCTCVLILLRLDYLLSDTEKFSSVKLTSIIMFLKKVESIKMFINNL